MTRLLPRAWTIRGRLTALYGSLFFVAGVILLALMYLLVWQILNRTQPQLPDSDSLRVALARMGKLPLGPNGQEVSLTDLITSVRAAQDQQRQDILDSLLAQGAVTLVGVGLVAAALGWLLARRALQPVHEITATAQRIATSDAGRGLQERIKHTGPNDEVTELAQTFNTMLERLDRSFDGQHRFIANASHEMRTPLAVKRALIEITVTRPGTSADAVQLGESLLEINARHERLIDGLLTLADSENELTERSPVDLADVAGHVVEQLAPAARDAGVDVRRAVSRPAPVVGDAVLLERLIQNLVENAIRHNQPDGWLSVATASADGWSSVTVSNSGPVVRPYEVDVLFQPFRRLERERTAGERGFGLGLSIARAISRSHQGDVHAVPRPDGGLDVTLKLPGQD
ncbi:sensor histidine kinase [Kibdelosporangium phytohabitans]|uniref:histidine kinase n=1 Tax=Kibdelosporangium phytohabitans TaxID=860235 RepID=A0A0N9IAB0_9PSEU|nr:HAMP domain-containing sensor histidine kinase [Kibdelosporangium phytohabitans]ALG13005.1 histidine kinase [Kibdelosporangium phytohabitans]MBE1464727.1 signal transduction histidine kinase [Kibdelosporangium phytohabitans]